MTYLILGGVLVGGAIISFIFLLVLGPEMAEERRLSQKAQEDYARCRGTQHAKQLEDAIRRHGADLQRRLAEQLQAASELQTLLQQERAELARALTIHLVQTRFTEIPGIGTKLKDRIVETCFDGTLDSLLRSSHVHGVGEEKWAAIRGWVYRRKQELPELLKTDFPKKQQLLDTFRSRREELNGRVKHLDLVVSARTRVISAATEELNKLKRVGSEDFKRALRGDREAAERVGSYTTGAFPEWGRTPRWFVDIMRQPGKELDEPRLLV
jgi:hypothetical protein